MEDMYYTPKIEEFQDGFEYEITNGYEWVKKSYSQKDLETFLYNRLDNAISLKYVRAKCSNTDNKK